MNSKPTSMRTRKRLYKFGLAVLLGLASITAISWYIFAKTKPRATPVKPAASTVAGAQYDYAGSPYARALNHAQDYLAQNIKSIRPFERLILDYLQRKYGLNPDLSAQHNAIKPPVLGQQEDAAEFRVYERIAYPSKKVSALPKTDDPMSRMMMAAAACDYIPLPADYQHLVQANIAAGGYNLTHVAFSLQRLKENSCHYFSARDEKVIENSVATSMAKLAAEPKTAPDLRYEAVAFLLDMGRRDLVQSGWILQIEADQKANGSWQIGTNPSQNDDHAMVLALWALAAYARPDAPNEPMIQHPN